MATYKVPQDVEAEDKLLGPLTFKQFIFFLIAAGAALVGWALFSIHPAMSLLALPVILVFGGLAVFRREDQPVERYLLSFFNFMLRPRTRIWSTEGYYEHLVLIPTKHMAPPPLKQDIQQVHGQLEKLAQIVDTRGWASKRPDLLLPSQYASTTDDRLFMPDVPVAEDQVKDSEDIMDSTNPGAQQLDSLLHEQTLQRREQVIQNMHRHKGQGSDGVGDGNDNGTDDDDGTSDDKSDATVEIPHYDPYGPGARHLRTIDPEGNKSDEEKDNEDPEDNRQKEANHRNNSDILEMSDQLTVSQVQAAVNHRENQDQLQKGEEISLR